MGWRKGDVPPTPRMKPKFGETNKIPEFDLDFQNEKGSGIPKVDKEFDEKIISRSLKDGLYGTPPILSNTSIEVDISLIFSCNVFTQTLVVDRTRGFETKVVVSYTCIQLITDNNVNRWKDVDSLSVVHSNVTGDQYHAKQSEERIDNDQRLQFPLESSEEDC
ncbi:hypothetical protein RFI_00074 [Reticulomyxa filosa]|uniref:Uncharacterized protein n=1 Tax=Reticulomyxa filosa TaxID=46433 RepID=X6PFJ8_RETFI|nr:hypothetical protein RFI_00074 [Reticulomyxa filosa]|eukprot:ETO36986.1 hypothetical protein RFI_00074 [Reticulomyxa filosa]